MNADERREPPAFIVRPRAAQDGDVDRIGDIAQSIRDLHIGDVPPATTPDDFGVRPVSAKPDEVRDDDSNLLKAHAMLARSYEEAAQKIVADAEANLADAKETAQNLLDKAEQSRSDAQTLLEDREARATHLRARLEAAKALLRREP